MSMNEKRILSVKEKQEKADELACIVRRYLNYYLGKQEQEASKEDLFSALALAVREIASDDMFETAARNNKKDVKKLYYLSVEYLIGRSLENNLHNLGLWDILDFVKLDTQIPWREVLDAEYDPALGNGGLGRLAACFMDSLATLGYPGYGYGINYQFGLFKQTFENGWQKEQADSWFVGASPWQFERMDRACTIPIYGRMERFTRSGQSFTRWVGYGEMIGVPYDMPIVGYGGKTVNYLRLFSAKASSNLDIKIFNEGGYFKAVEDKIIRETISKVLYPSDASEAGKELRLVQQYFFVACALSDIIRRFKEEHIDFNLLPEKVAIQMNDTHPALAVAELMRILVDLNNLPWDKAWEITTKVFAYTNHTLLPEALEKWSVPLLERVLPRHLEIIYLINMNFMREVSDLYNGDIGKMSRMSIIEEGNVKKVRMANLAVVGSHSVNGVARLHSDLIKKNLMPDFYQMWPEKFNNKTNGITPRRWLLCANSDLADLITSKIGQGWITDLMQLKKLEPLVEDKNFLRDFWDVKTYNKERLSALVEKTTGVELLPNALFDIQVKRIHEYKRQLLNILHVMYQYLCIVHDDKIPTCPRNYIFGGKAAPSYDMAKLIIKLINNVADIINSDEKANKYIRVAFIPDYKVSVAERIFPAADVSEQISTAGFEASGTGNMKFMLNGAVTIGTLDGANIEIREEVGEDNFYLFGLSAQQVMELKKSGKYNPWDYYNKDSRIRKVLDALNNDLFCPKEPDLFKRIFQNLMYSDYYMVIADLGSYIDAQNRISNDFNNKDLWVKKAVKNMVRSGKFSSDRTIEEYANDIWHIKKSL